MTEEPWFVWGWVGFVGVAGFCGVGDFFGWAVKVFVYGILWIIVWVVLNHIFAPVVTFFIC